jgi:hypothetical protein
LKLGEIVRGTQICNFIGKILPPTTTKIKIKITSPSAKKNPEKFADLKTSIS